MKVIDVPQGSDEWLVARLGVPTASCADLILTPKTRKPSGSQDKYLARLCAEWFIGQPLDDVKSPWMERGSEMEAEAVRAYEFDAEADASAVGFCLRDDGCFGASPDRLVGSDGLLEIKCPSAETHMTYLLADGGVAGDYWGQVQAQLWVTGRKWVDLLSYHPTLPRVRSRVERDDAYIDAFAVAVTVFAMRLGEAKAKLTPLRDAQRASRLAASNEDDSEQPF